MNPYILQGQAPQDVSGLQPVFQNFGQQQANQQAALAQQNQQVQQAGQIGNQGGSNAMAMAMMLRKKNSNTPNNSDMPNPISPYDYGSLNNPAAQTNLYGAD